ncbi:MAG TPA: hypothetical protein VEV15_13345 [Flavisolibacter sp.]|nr:hypothetical protein [Flavisolibacter sp.]
MKKQMFSLVAALSLGFAACNSDSQTSATSDTTTTINTTTSGDYAGMADEFDRNSEAGKYMDVRTGKPIKISVDKTTGKKVNVETSEPVTRYIYVDDSDWWVYDWEGNRLGRAKLQDEKVLFEDSANNWVDYEVMWKNDNDESKMKSDDIKIKTEKDGDTKIKTKDKKIKIDEDGRKEKDN